MTASKLLCAPEQKAALEARNALDQLEYLRFLVETRHVTQIRPSHVFELQQIAVADIYPCGGKLRDAHIKVEIPKSGHVPPPAARVSAYVDELLDVINSRSTPAPFRAAFALWRLNWIHPFAGGNGRTARAIAYLVLCIDLGRMLPGVPTMPSLIAADRDRYLDALQSADKHARGTDNSTASVATPAVVRVMTLFVTRVAMLQMLNALPIGTRMRTAGEFLVLVADVLRRWVR